MARIDKRPLRAAFLEMRKHGILAEGEWTCCLSCGVAEMQEVADRYPKGRTPIGYCFYHGQDTDSLEETGTTMLAFGSLCKISDVEVGRIAVECLNRAGVSTVWSGSERQRIQFTLPRRRNERTMA